MYVEYMQLYSIISENLQVYFIKKMELAIQLYVRETYSQTEFYKTNMLFHFVN